MLKPKLAVKKLDKKKPGVGAQPADFIADFKERILELSVIHEILATEEELGCVDLIRIMPDTWQNISWVISNATSILINQTIG